MGDQATHAACGSWLYCADRFDGPDEARGHELGVTNHHHVGHQHGVGLRRPILAGRCEGSVKASPPYAPRLWSDPEPDRPLHLAGLRRGDSGCCCERERAQPRWDNSRRVGRFFWARCRQHRCGDLSRHACGRLDVVDGDPPGGACGDEVGQDLLVGCYRGDHRVARPIREQFRHASAFGLVGRDWLSDDQSERCARRLAIGPDPAGDDGLHDRPEPFAPFAVHGARRGCAVRLVVCDAAITTSDRSAVGRQRRRNTRTRTSRHVARGPGGGAAAVRELVLCDGSALRSGTASDRRIFWGLGRHSSPKRSRQHRQHTVQRPAQICPPIGHRRLATHAGDGLRADQGRTGGQQRRLAHRRRPHLLR